MDIDYYGVKNKKRLYKDFENEEKSTQTTAAIVYSPFIQCCPAPSLIFTPEQDSKEAI